jgi:hypothetical protein
VLAQLHLSDGAAMPDLLARELLGLGAVVCGEHLPPVTQQAYPDFGATLANCCRDWSDLPTHCGRFTIKMTWAEIVDASIFRSYVLVCLGRGFRAI